MEINTLICRLLYCFLLCMPSFLRGGEIPVKSISLSLFSLSVSLTTFGSFLYISDEPLVLKVQRDTGDHF